MDFTELLRELATKISGGTDAAEDSLRKIIINEVNNSLMEVREDAVKLGIEAVKAILFGSAVKYVDFEIITDDELANITTEEALRREAILAAHAAQMAVVAQAEREYQESAAAVRKAAVGLIQMLLRKLGNFGVGLLASSLL